MVFQEFALSAFLILPKCKGLDAARVLKMLMMMLKGKNKAVKLKILRMIDNSSVQTKVHEMSRTLTFWHRSFTFKF